jgi:hypothetical protein
MSRFIKTHIPCPKCGSSEAAAINSDGWRHCFSCNEREKVHEATEQMVSRTPSPQFDVILTALAKATPESNPRPQANTRHRQPVLRCSRRRPPDIPILLIG